MRMCVAAVLGCLFVVAASGCVFDHINDELVRVNASLEHVQEELEDVRSTNEQLVQLQDKLKTLDSIDASLKKLDGHLASLRKTIENIDSTIPFISFSADDEADETATEEAGDEAIGTDQDANGDAGDAQAGNTNAPAALNFNMQSITGEQINLAREYDGDVVLMVNVASQCGFTPQYEGLQILNDKYAQQGLRVLGFPANNFRGQEPGSNREILQFCTEQYNVTFPLFAKISVKGDDIAPLYKYLTDQQQVPASGGPIQWNFEKFLLDRQGNVVKHYRSRATPEEIEPDIVAELAK